MPAYLTPVSDYICLKCGRPLGVEIVGGKIELVEWHFKTCPEAKNNGTRHIVKA